MIDQFTMTESRLDNELLLLENKVIVTGTESVTVNVLDVELKLPELSFAKTFIVHVPGLVRLVGERMMSVVGVPVVV